MQTILSQTRPKCKREFSTVAPMRMSSFEQRSRPNIHTCHICGGLPLLEVTGKDGLLYLVDCPACSGRGYIDRQEWHPAAWLPRWALNLMTFVGAL